MHDDKVKAALAAMRRASAHHLLSSAEQAKLLAVAEAALAKEAAFAVLGTGGRRLWNEQSRKADEASQALDAALAALAEP